MNKLLILCGLASLIATATILIAQRDSSESITIHSSEWECRDTMPVGLHGECTNLVRKVKMQARAN